MEKAPLKVVVDAQIPYIGKSLQNMVEEVLFLPGKEMTREVVQDADALLVRTRTRCNASLLTGSKVQFIGTATIGYDHIDTKYCAEKGIKWQNCPGCNANSVAQYIQNALFLLQEKWQLDFTKETLGVIGVGEVGRRVATLGKALGVKVLCYDPLNQTENFEYVTLSTLQKEATIITCHTPLTYDGDYPTFHLVDEAFFQSLEHNVFFFNTSRGEVVDTAAIKDALCKGKVKDAVIDVWENEPFLDTDLLEQVFLGTPHIAGYSADGKANATRMVLEAFCRHFSLPTQFRIFPPELPEAIVEKPGIATYLAYYDPRKDSEALKTTPSGFESQRNHYPLRREKLICAL